MYSYLWIMIGLPASGKSTKVKELFYDKNRRDVDILSTDAIIEMRCKNKNITYSEGFSEFIKEATKIFFANFTIAVKENRSIVIDRTNLTKKSRAKFLNMVPNHYKNVAIVVECDNKKEYHDRLHNRPGKSIPDSVIENMKKTYEPPSFNEGFSSIIYFNENGEII